MACHFSYTFSYQSSSIDKKYTLTGSDLQSEPKRFDSIYLSADRQARLNQLGFPHIGRIIIVGIVPLPETGRPNDLL